MPDTGRTTVDFWFDPLCPWTWTTSRWLLEVEQTRDIEIHWHVLSLAILNEPRLAEIPEQYRELLGPKGWRPVRVVTAAQQTLGDEAAVRLYTALGTRFHLHGEGPTHEAIAQALKDAGLPAELIEHADTDTYDTQVRASHEAGVARAGEEAGSPLIALPDGEGGQHTYSGPVVSPAPKGEAAAKLWDGLLLLAATPGLYEIKRARPQGPSFD